MADNEQKAYLLIAEAEKIIARSNSFLYAIFLYRNFKIDEAVERYQKAANLFKIENKWSQAGKLYCECARLQQNSSDSRFEAAASFTYAAICFKKTDHSEAVNCYLKAIEIYLEMGKFFIAAKHHQAIAELYEQNLGDIGRAVQHYEQAADYFNSEEHESSANRCFMKVAKLAAKLENYKKAIQLYERLALAALDNTLLKSSAKEYFFRAVLCHMCVDVLDSQSALFHYETLDPSFQDSKEYKILRRLLECIEEESEENFTRLVEESEFIPRLDKWFIMILLRIKKNIVGELNLQ